MSQLVSERTPTKFPAETQPQQPGLEHKMEMKPAFDAPWYKGAGKLQDKVALITGGDSGIGRSIAILYAREGCDVVINYLPSEEKDAQITKQCVEKEGKKCLCIPADICDVTMCKKIVQQTVEKFGKIDILVNNAAVQVEQTNLEDITPEQLDKTFKTNIYAMFFITQEALKHMKEGCCIINTTSINAYKGHPTLMDYTSTKGAIVAFTYSLAANVMKRGIRVNAVAPGPIWTPLIPSSFKAEKMPEFGHQVPMQRAGQPEEVAPAYVFLAAKDACYISGQVIHVNGGVVIHG